MIVFSCRRFRPGNSPLTSKITVESSCPSPGLPLRITPLPPLPTPGHQLLVAGEEQLEKSSAHLLSPIFPLLVTSDLWQEKNS
jgi:hypothetical protein